VQSKFPSQIFDQNRLAKLMLFTLAAYHLLFNSAGLLVIPTHYIKGAIFPSPIIKKVLQGISDPASHGSTFLAKPSGQLT
jgi:hypothetical protein